MSKENLFVDVFTLKFVIVCVAKRSWAKIVIDIKKKIATTK